MSYWKTDKQQTVSGYDKEVEENKSENYRSAS